MAEKDPIQPNASDEKEPTILRNEYGSVVDPTVVVDEPGRTVMLTDNETIIIEKEPQYHLTPKSRERKVYQGMWGPVELGVLGAGMLGVLAAVLLYVLFVSPSNRELENNRTRKERLEAELISAREKYGNISDTETQVARLISSVNDFEAQYLPLPTTGRTAVYQRINGLIVSHGLVNSAGPDYAPLDILDKANQNGEEDRDGKGRFRSFFPGVYVTMTVEGSYANLRSFVNALETASEFIVVSAVELEPSDAQEKDPAQATTAGVPPGVDPTTAYPSATNTSVPLPAVQGGGLPSSRGKTHGTVVSLRLEMAAYFRRPTSPVPAAPEVVQQ